MTVFDRWYGRLMRRWAEAPRCVNHECRNPRADRSLYCSESCAERHQELNAW